MKSPAPRSSGGFAGGRPPEISGPDTQRGNGPQAESSPAVPTAAELFGDEALGRLRYSRELAEVVEGLRACEAQIAGQAKSVARPGLLCAYAGLIAGDLSKVGLALPDATHDNAAGIFQAVTSFPFSTRTAGARRKAREVARFVMLSDNGDLHVPARVEDLHGLWEQAMCGEPRWSADYPSSAFRTGGVTVRGAWPERTLLHRCMDPCEMPAWLERLIGMLADEGLAPELRAACGLGLHDWIHPFVDGNGHTGRLLMLSVLDGLYSQPTLVCLAHELVANRSTTMRQFARLRNREADAAGFCLGLLGQLRDAQKRAPDILEAL